MTSSKKLKDLVINRVESKEVYQNLIDTGRINEDELYLIEGDVDSDTIVDVQINGESIVNNKNVNIITNSNYDSVNNKIATMNELNVVNNSTLTIQKNGSTVDSVTLNSESNKTINIPISKTDIGLGNVENKSSATIRNELTTNNITDALGYTPLNSNLKGANNGIAELDSQGKVPSAQLPSYVDDVLEYSNVSSFPDTGESGIIYVATSTNKTYRWSGSDYIEISESLALGTTSSTAFRGDYGNTAYQHALNKGQAYSSGLYKITSNSEGHITNATVVVKSDITNLGIPGQDTTYNVATTSSNGLMSSADKSKLDGLTEGTKVSISETEPENMNVGDIWMVIESST